jgi:hypothetical protein
MLFRKKMPRSCAYCVHGVVLEDEQVLCAKKGVRTVYDKCRKFHYDPCKRVPVKAKAMDFAKYEKEDFSL